MREREDFDLDMSGSYEELGKTKLETRKAKLEKADPSPSARDDIAARWALPLGCALGMALRVMTRPPPGGLGCVANKGLAGGGFWKCGNNWT